MTAELKRSDSGRWWGSWRTGLACCIPRVCEGKRDATVGCDHDGSHVQKGLIDQTEAAAFGQEVWLRPGNSLLDLLEGERGVCVRDKNLGAWMTVTQFPSSINASESPFFLCVSVTLQCLNKTGSDRTLKTIYLSPALWLVTGQVMWLFIWECDWCDWWLYRFTPHGVALRSDLPSIYHQHVTRWIIALEFSILIGRKPEGVDL